MKPVINGSPFWSRAVSGTSLGPDSDANEKIYGKKLTGEQIFDGSGPPASADVLLSTLQAKSPKNASEGKS
jgi:lipid-binding SYLF domain-containing protein